MWTLPPPPPPPPRVSYAVPAKSKPSPPKETPELKQLVAMGFARDGEWVLGTVSGCSGRGVGAQDGEWVLGTGSGCLGR